MDKYNILFVGSFKTVAKDGSVGGQMFACKTIINSKLSEVVNWTLIDSTAQSNKKTNIIIRFFRAFLRILLLIFYLFNSKYHAVLIFTSNGMSFWEKGLMVFISKVLSKANVIIAPRSGFIINDINKKGALSKFIKIVFDKSDYVICQSKFWKLYFENISNNYNDKFQILENCIEFSKYENNVNEINHGDVIEILFLAWVDKNKGIFELIDACRLLKKDKINFKLTIAGNGNEFDEVKRKIELYNLENEISLYGWALNSDKVKLLKRSNIFVLPSYYEGYPNSLIEAMASSNACIATNVGSIPDIIENGINGYLINPQNTIELYEKLRELLLDRKKIEILSLNAKQTIIKNNTSEIFTNKMRSILKL
ncbi:glycosyltransferase [Flavobacterium sp.]|jgi:glycosyltransferase involved in cell wall biosynthesis|uniref:glycosyltransferase n=1 Tax=Flavobacterium sp. TaxID=239 RepID=UPI0037C07A2B